jgi:signal transduction histidine kinase
MSSLRTKVSIMTFFQSQMKQLINRLLRNSLPEQIPAEDVLARQKFMLFRIFSFTGMVASTGVFIKMQVTIHEAGVLPYFILALAFILGINFYAVGHIRKLRLAYFLMLISACALLHLVSYSCGGIRTAGTMYFSVVILYAFMLLGNRPGKWFTALVIVHVVYLFFISTYTNRTSFDFFKNDLALINQDFLINAILTFLLIASHSSYLQSGKNVVIRRLEQTAAELKEKNNALKGKNRLLQRYASGLEKSNRELDKFASVASHDLKAPLRAIGASVGMIEEDSCDKIDDEMKSHLNVIKGRVVRMEQLLNALLEYSRADREQGTDEVVDTRELAEELRHLLCNEHHQRLKISNKLPVLVADRARLKIVLSHLITNAIVHSDKPVVEMELDCFEKYNAWEFSLKDNGPGIDKAFHERIFVIFQTLNRRDKFDTMGAGLAISKKIIEERGGTIRIESRPGSGACFLFSIPKKSATAVKLQ